MPTPCTLTLDLKLDDDVGTPADLWDAVLLLAKVKLLPSNTLKLTFVTADLEGADKVQEIVQLALMDRAYGVTAELTRKTKEGLLRKVAPPPPTPMEREIARSKAATPAEPIIVDGYAQLEGDAVAVLELPASLVERITEALHRSGPLTAADLAVQLGADLAAVEETLADLARGRWLTQNGAGRWWFTLNEDSDEPTTA